MAELREILCPRCRKGNLPRARFCQACGADVLLNNERPGRDELRYRLTRIIKQGGQGSVFEGIDQYGRIYAVKEMLDRFTDQREKADALERFNSEAELLQQLTHQRIPRVYSHFTDDGRHYLAMDFVRGEDLEQILERSGRLSEARVLELAAQICDVLSYLHVRGLIYRDMKPSNVMIEADGGVKLIDFGIAKLFKPTERGTQIGTPGYAPPEQYQGLATPQSDVYALAATLHHLLTGRDPTRELPFVFPPARSIEPSISIRTSTALEHALQKVATDRFPSMSAFWAALRPLPAAVTPQPAAGPLQPAVSPLRPAAPPAARAAARAGAAAAARVAATPPAAPTVQTASAVAPTVQAASAVAPTVQATSAVVPTVQATAPARRARRAGCLRIVILLLFLSAVAAIGSQIVFGTNWPAQFSPGILGASPAPVSSFQVTYELDVTLPVGHDAAALNAAFRAAYQQRARSEFGTGASVNQNVPPSYVGGQPIEIGNNGTTVSYRGRMTGYISVP